MGAFRFLRWSIIHDCLISYDSILVAVPWDKNYLQQYTQKEGLPLPLYVTVSNGSLHSPRFTSKVVVNGVSYTSCGDFSTRKAAEMDVARIALQGVQQQVEKCSIGQEVINCIRIHLSLVYFYFL